MNGFDYRKRSKNTVRKFVLILSIPFIILITAYIAYRLFFIPDPVIKGIEAFNFLPVDKTITLNSEHIESINIFINQGAKKIDLLSDTPESSEKTYTLQIKPKDLGLTDGPATVIVKAKSGILKKVEYEINSTIDTAPPTLKVLKTPSIIYQGSGGFALLGAKDADSVFVKIAGHIFRAFKATADTRSKPVSTQDFRPGSEVSGSQNAGTPTYLVFFPAPFDIKEGSVFYAVAEDVAGNQSVRALPTRLKAKKYKTSSINIDDSFINLVVSPLLNEINIDDPVSAFKKVNEEWREKILRKLVEIGRGTEPEFFLKGRFLQLKNSKVMAAYGDRRVYFYKGKAISKSVHLGYDLASVRNAPVEAANSGIVKFAGDLGIYGNTVIIDHGLGLMSLYGHLSAIMVTDGQAVKKGEVIAKTGSTGLAGGDHLHFAILIHGYEVSPLYWWDPDWIKVNVLEYLKSINTNF